MSHIAEFYLKTLSPVHIGCGENFSPISYSLDLDNKRLIVGNDLELISQITPKEKDDIISACNRGEEGFYYFLKFTLKKDIISPVTVDLADELVREYKEILEHFSDKKGQARFTPPRTAYLKSDGRPYIPGSSLKGAIRTAILNILADKAESLFHIAGSEKDYKAKWLENLLLTGKQDSEATDDPLACLSVSDFMPIGNISSKILFDRQFKKHSVNKPEVGISDVIQVVMPDNIFVGTISILDKPSGNSENSYNPSIEDIFSSSSFYQGEFAREQKEIEEANLIVSDISEPRGALFRIGRHSGAECVTIKGFRRIRIKRPTGDGDKYGSGATTFWFASESSTRADGIFPYGWIEIGLLSADEKRKLEAEEEAYRKEYDKIQDQIRERRRAILLEKKKYEEERKREEEERKQQEAERKEILAKLENLEGNKKSIYLIQFYLNNYQKGDDYLLKWYGKGREDVENEVVSLYKKLDELGESEKKETAQLLKRFYQVMNKWDRVSSEKQREKVKKIKDILGEG